MKILLLNRLYSPHFGGIENSMKYMAKEFKKQGHEPVILVKQSSKDLLLQEQIDNIEVYRYPCPLQKLLLPLYPLIEILYAKKYLKTFLKEQKPDLIISRNPNLGYATLKVINNIKFIYMPARATPEFYYEMIKRKLHKKIMINLLYKIFIIPQYSFIEKKLIIKSDLIVTFSKNVKDELISYYKIKAHKKFKIIPPGVDFGKFNINKTKKDEQIKNLNLHEKDKVVLYVGRLTSEKNVDLLIRSIAKIKDKDIKLLVVGEGNEKENLLKLAKKLGIEDKTVFIGKRGDTENFYAIADLFVLPTFKEGFGQVYLEAMALGVPCIGFKSRPPKIMTATDEVLIDGKTGFIIENPTINDLSKTIIKYFNLNKKERK